MALFARALEKAVDYSLAVRLSEPSVRTFSHTRCLSLSLLLGTATACAGKEEPCPPGSVRAADGLCHLSESADSGAADLEDDLVSITASLSPLPALPPSPTNAYADDPAAIELGHALFYEPSLSPSGEFPCVSCHDPEITFTDGKRTGEGNGVVARNACRLSIRYYDWHLWDGCDTIWCQATIPIEAAAEMDANRVELARTIYQNASLRGDYEAIFGSMPDMDDPRFPEKAKPEPLTPDTPMHNAWEGMTDADKDAVNRVSQPRKVARAFQRTIVSSPSRFDQFAEAVAAGDSAGAASPSRSCGAVTVRRWRAAFSATQAPSSPTRTSPIPGSVQGTGSTRSTPVASKPPKTSTSTFRVWALQRRRGVGKAFPTA